MRNAQFEKLISKAGLYLVHTSMSTPRFAVAMRIGNKYQAGIFKFEPDAFRAMTEEQAKEYIKKCKDSMRKELDRVCH
jgi:hypothetical protein